jgi:hypothetical protein
MNSSRSTTEQDTRPRASSSQRLSQRGVIDISELTRDLKLMAAAVAYLSTALAALY